MKYIHKSIFFKQLGLYNVPYEIRIRFGEYPLSGVYTFYGIFKVITK